MDTVHAPRTRLSNARHRAAATASVGVLLLKLFVTLRWWYYPLLLSDYGRMILKRKYDAIATDHAYHAKPSGRWGFFGRFIDRKVLALPIHEALRARLALVTTTLVDEARKAAATTTGPVRVLSAPCGASRDILDTAATLRKVDPAIAARVDLHGLDLDETNECIPLSKERAKAEGVPVTYHKQDLFAPGALPGKFHVVNCIGLTAWVDLPEVTKLARHFRENALVPGGVLVVDNWNKHSTSHMGKHMQIETRYHERESFVAAIERGGFKLERAQLTPDGIVQVDVFRAL